MKILKISTLIVLFALILAGCNVKLNLNSNLNQSQIKIEPNANTNQGNLNANTNQNANANQNANENANQNINAAPQAKAEYEISASPEKLVTEIKIGEVTLKDFKELCGNDVMVYAEPKNGFIIFQAFNPGSDKPVSSLYSLDLNSKGCKKLSISKELSDFGARVLSPDQTKLALALETNEAQELKLVDLIKDTSKVLVTLPEGETLNGGYGALSNHFDLKWLDDKTIQYAVYEDTVKNYAANAPENIEKVLQVRVLKVE
ncbi:MAG: hypothetical protein NTX00_02860 [Candidatus Parcubacteria bacterium]|nr:hypothetical protein [Candidatus Parcubacteria bacterium]